MLLHSALMGASSERKKTEWCTTIYWSYYNHKNNSCMVIMYYRTKCTVMPPTSAVKRKNKKKSPDSHWKLFQSRLHVTLPAFCEARTALTRTASLCCLGILKLLFCYYQLFKKGLGFFACELESFVAFSIMVFLINVAGRYSEIILNTDILYLSALTVPTASAAADESYCSEWKKLFVRETYKHFHLHFLI